MLGLQVDPTLYMRQMEPEHLLPLPEGAPSWAATERAPRSGSA